MLLIDTMVLVGALNAKDPLHRDASEHLGTVKRDSDTFVPLSSAIEFDLVMKGRGYTSREREDAFDWLGYMIPPNKVICNSLVSLREAVNLQEKRVGYFDSMIAALALAENAVVVTRDKVISEVVKTAW